MSHATLRAPRFGTVRSRLTLLATALVAAVLLLSAIGLVTVQQRLLGRGVDEALVQRADNIGADVASGAYGSLLPGEGDREDSFLQLIDHHGTVIAASGNVQSLPATTTALPRGTHQDFRTISQIPLSSHEFRVLARSVRSDGATNTLIVAKNLDDVNESVRILTASLALSIPVVVCLLAAVVWWLTGRVLRPVEAIRAEVSSIGGSELHRRVPVHPTSDEISRLARTMNAMLDRVQEATDRQRQFAADASHELRTPLTRIRAALEVALTHPNSTDPASTYRSVLEDTTQLHQLIDDLLFLARSEPGDPAPTTSVDLDDLVFERARDLRARARVQVDTTAVSAARIHGDANQLARAILNLTSNAERHANTTVTFELSEQDGRSVLVVADDGPGIPADQHQAVFKRFTRLDEARSRDAGGAGLGLAIVADIVTRHHGTITIRTSHTGGARIVVTFPRAE